MWQSILLIHPVGQLFGIILALYVFYLGLQRVRSLHARRNKVFKWKRHVFLGIIVTLIFVGGFTGGSIIAYRYWHRLFMTKIHSKIGLLIGFLILFGLGSGLYMNSVKKKRVILPFIHGLSNFVTLLLALSQIWTGVLVYLRYILLII